MAWTPPSPLPKYVYKIIPTAPLSPIPETYPPSDLDRQDGFIHLSNAEQIRTTWGLADPSVTQIQVPKIADMFFTQASRLWVLKLRFSPPFAEKTRWEGPMDGCVHLYGEFGAADVEDAKEFTRSSGVWVGGDESWAATMTQRDGEHAWLE
ncbi:hypothetical protein PG993_001652 [Apiospora rasikravindrae]|uniref:DUF952 domain-containing protein n=1 Tax=Apiospora rasikravindrae TaxID=990691 RepID=A0ABR1UC12_9PEZI